jgi:hypothetical protein
MPSDIAKVKAAQILERVAGSLLDETDHAERILAEEIDGLCERIDELLTENEGHVKRRDEHLALIRTMSTESVSPDEADELRAQIAALIAEVGTQRSMARNRRDVYAAYVVDRSEQLDHDSGTRSAFRELAVKLQNGEADAAHAHGELDDLLPGEALTYTIWRMMIGRDGNESTAIDIIVPNDRPRNESVNRATARFYEKLEAGTLGTFFYGEPEEWIVRGMNIIAEEATL